MKERGPLRRVGVLALLAAVVAGLLWPIGVFATFPVATPTILPLYDSQLIEGIRAALARTDLDEVTPEELERVLAPLLEGHDLAIKYLAVSGGCRTVLVLALQPEDSFACLPYFFWRDGAGAVQAQEWPSQSLLYPLLQDRPRQVRTVCREGAVEMGLIPALIGGRGFATYSLLRLEQGRWQEVWDASAAMASGEWNGVAGAVGFLGEAIGVLRLLGPLPEKAVVPRFFIEYLAGAQRQEYLAFWRRQSDEYLPVYGTVRESRLKALTEFMLALTAGEEERAARRSAGPEVVAEALALGLDGLSPGQWVAVAAEPGNDLLLQRSTDGGLETPAYRVFFALRQGRWLVQGVAME